ncbi:MAG: hypothetical protein H5U40_08915 [Polyangiaceae bacterium]|nr:hypothetical protein [Polyangiaceae bacterium]
MTEISRRRLRYAASAERSVARFRLGSALIVFPCAIAVLAFSPSLVTKAFAFLGVLVSIAWVISFFFARSRLRNAGAFYLDLGPEGLSLAMGGAPIEVSWREVHSVEVDEERLLVVLRLTGGTTLDVPPVWEGVGIYDLCDLIDGTRDGASGASHR